MPWHTQGAGTRWRNLTFLQTLSAWSQGILACSRRSDSGVRAKKKASERAGKKRGETLPQSPLVFFPLFRSLSFSLALHYLNAWNRLKEYKHSVMNTIRQEEWSYDRTLKLSRFIVICSFSFVVLLVVVNNPVVVQCSDCCSDCRLKKTLVCVPDSYHRSIVLLTFLACNTTKKIFSRG